MRRKSERTATKKTKASPEKKVDKVKRTRTSRRKQSTSSENEPEEGSPVREVENVEEPVKEALTTPVKEPSPEESQDQVWQVKSADASGDAGDIQKLKICLTRPPSTPERAERSPRSKRKHSRATSSSDTPSSEGVDDKKRSRRSRRVRESKDESDKNQDSQGDEPEEKIESISEKPEDGPDNERSESTKHQKKQAPDETPVSTTNDEGRAHAPKTQNQESCEETEQDKSHADTTVASPKAEAQTSDAVTPERQSPERRRSDSVEKSEVLELHAEADESKIESSGSQLSKLKESKEQEAENSRDQDRASSREEVSTNQDKSEQSVSEGANSGKNYRSKTINENDVVESSVKVEKKKRSRKVSADSGKDKEATEEYRNRDVERTNSLHDTSQANQDEPVQNGPAPAPIVVNRKRKWGSRPKLATQKSITISTDVLKEIIPDVKPAEFEEVIEEKQHKEKQHKRIEVVEKIERPVLPKIVIYNTESVERDEEKPHKEIIKKETNLAANRRISIVKENVNIPLGRPPSPPRHKQSNVLYISNLVRPFTLPQLKNLLQRTGRIVENGFWIDRIKSKCFVQFENEDQAVETRHALHGVTWPVSNPKTLQVDFSTEEAFEKARLNEENEPIPTSNIPGTVEDWLREQDLKRERGELEKPWERKAAMREWDMGKNEKDKDGIKDRLRRDDRGLDKRRHRSQERSPEPARKFKKKEEEAPAKLLDDLFRKTDATPCIYWLPLSAETIAIKEEQRRKHMEEHERRLLELRRHREQRERDRRH